MNNSTRQSAINIRSREDKEKGKKKFNVAARIHYSAKCTRNQAHTNLIVIHVCWTRGICVDFFINARGILYRLVVRRVLAIRTTISISFPPFLLNQLIVSYSSINNLFPINCGLHPW